VSLAQLRPGCELPLEWLARHRLLTIAGRAEGDALRFNRGQLGLLDSLLEAIPEAQIDAQLRRARSRLARASSR
jgi:hypothetical protein